MKLSESIEQLVGMWIVWMRHNAVVSDKTKSFKERRYSAMECERLISLESQIVSRMDEVFPFD